MVENAVSLALLTALVVVLGLVYFLVNLWIVQQGSRLLGYNVSGDWAALTAALLSVGGVVGGGLRAAREAEAPKPGELRDRA